MYVYNMELFMGKRKNCEGGRAKGEENGLSRRQNPGSSAVGW